MIEKITTFNLIPNQGFEILDGELVKTASFILPDGVDYDPDYVYMIVRAVSAGEYWGANKNLDYFPEEELLKGYKTFLSAHTFKNHENKNIENAIGDVLKTEWNDKMKCVELILRIDRRIAPTIARGFEKGFMTDVSMGCRIDHSVCSICGNKAKNRFEFCEHIKTMKGKVFDDGRKVYEINIGPKFHDISTVLNGAERTAKVLSLYVHNSKVTANINKSAGLNNNSMEKVASFEGTFSKEDIAAMRIQTKQAMLETPIFEKIASNLSFEEKLAEAKEIIQEKVIDKAVDNVSKKGHQSLDKVSDIINLLYTDYWTKEKCTEIGSKLRQLAKDKGKSEDDTFNQFVRVADFAGIKLSPLELGDIYSATTGGKTPDLRQIKMDKTTPEDVQKDSDKAMINIDSKYVNTPSVCRVIKYINNSDMQSIDKPKPTLIGLTIKMSEKNPMEVGNDLEDNIMQSIVSSLMESRSNHPRFLLPRLQSIIKGEVEPRNDYIQHHAPTKLLNNSKKMEKHGGITPFLLSGMMHVAYENDRINRLKSGELENGINKFAFYIDDTFGLEKTAKSATGLALSTIPLTFSYSALQRSRLNNGEDISSANRFVAENPNNAALLVSIGTKAGAKAVKKKRKQIINTFRKISKKASEDFFKSAELDDIMLEKGYSKEQLKFIKTACLLMEFDKYAAEDIMKHANVSDETIGNYLQEATNCITIDIEKYASIGGIGNIVKDSVVADTVFRKDKGPLAASLPGYIVDGLALAGISKGIEKVISRRDKTNG